MTFVDASAIVAILGREPGHEELERRLAMAAMPLIVSPLVKFEATELIYKGNEFVHTDLA